MKNVNRDIAFWLLGKYCGEVLYCLKKVDFDDRLQRVSYQYIHGGCKNRDDYEFLVEQYRLFQKLPKDGYIISELLD